MITTILAGINNVLILCPICGRNIMDVSLEDECPHWVGTDEEILQKCEANSDWETARQVEQQIKAYAPGVHGFEFDEAGWDGTGETVRWHGKLKYACNLINWAEKKPNTPCPLTGHLNSWIVETMDLIDELSPYDIKKIMDKRLWFSQLTDWAGTADPKPLLTQNEIWKLRNYWATEELA